MEIEFPDEIWVLILVQCLFKKTAMALLTISTKMTLRVSNLIPRQFGHINMWYDSLIRYFTKLKDLKLGHNPRITDHGISLLTNLTTLDLNHNQSITDRGL